MPLQITQLKSLIKSSKGTCFLSSNAHVPPDYIIIWLANYPSLLRYHYLMSSYSIRWLVNLEFLLRYVFLLMPKVTSHFTSSSNIEPPFVVDSIGLTSLPKGYSKLTRWSQWRGDTNGARRKNLEKKMMGLRVFGRRLSSGCYVHRAKLNVLN